MDELQQRRLRRRIAAFQLDQAAEATSWSGHQLVRQIKVAIANNQPLTCIKLMADYDARHPQLMSYRASDCRSVFGPIWLQTERAIMNGDATKLREMYKLQRIVHS